jgi:hypothetical protein
MLLRCDPSPAGDPPTSFDPPNFTLQGVSQPADTYLAMGTTRRLRTSAPGSPASVISHASVPIEAAGELAGVEVGQIRRWAANGAVEIEQRGELEVIRLDVVEALARSARTSHRDRRYMLRRLLDGARLETRSVIELQMLAREREPASAP